MAAHARSPYTTATNLCPIWSDTTARPQTFQARRGVCSNTMPPRLPHGYQLPQANTCIVQGDRVCQQHHGHTIATNRPPTAPLTAAARVRPPKPPPPLLTAAAPLAARRARSPSAIRRRRETRRIGTAGSYCNTPWMIQNLQGSAFPIGAVAIPGTPSARRQARSGVLREHGHTTPPLERPSSRLLRLGPLS